MRIEEAGCSIVIVPPLAWITSARRAILQGMGMMPVPHVIMHVHYTMTWYMGFMTCMNLACTWMP